MDIELELKGKSIIGGIGDIKKKTIRFHSFRTGMENGQSMIYAIYEPSHPPKLFNGYSSGQDLLVELTNLHIETYQLNEEDAGEVIIGWCRTHIFPYYNYGDLTVSIAKDNDPADSWDLLVNVVECYSFPVAKMRQNLKKLHRDMMSVFAVKSLLEGEYYQAKCYLDAIVPKVDTQIIEGWQKSHKDRQLIWAEEFLNTNLPKFELKVEVNMSTGRLELAPEVKSVFDAAYYALARFVTVNSGALDDWGGKTNITFCQGCGRAFIKRGNRQKYCSTPECQSIRNQRKSKDYYYREKQKEIDDILS